MIKEKTDACFKCHVDVPVFGMNMLVTGGTFYALCETCMKQYSKAASEFAQAWLNEVPK